MLPRFEGSPDEPIVMVPDEERYQPIKVLGAGGMGEVLLGEDRDIGRRVAIKQMHLEMSSPANVARFVEEIRVVGALEHPNIVPIHDVGVDPSGRLYFVMKNIEGETLESVIEHLRAGDQAYHREYTFERRIHVFLSLLNALEFAHSRGFVHRDIKPANVMVGRFGEVVLMDWGIAKSNAPTVAATPCETASRAEKPAKIAVVDDKTARPSVLQTQVGALLGTPAYMSPEQARGDNQAIDSRSDLYSAGVLFHEFLTLNYYFSEHQTVPALLAAIVYDDPRVDDLNFRWNHHPTQPHPPVELLYFVRRVLQKAPERRLQTAHAMIEQLQGILEGKVNVQCHVTSTKRLFRELGRLVDRYTHLVTAGLLLWAILSIASIAIIVRWLL